jgi:hypothetical protein
LAREDGRERACGCGFVAGVAGGQPLEGGLDGGEVVEGVEAVGTAAEFAGGLGAAEHEQAENGGLIAAKVEDGADAVLVLGDAAVADGSDEGEVFEGVERLADLIFSEFEDGVAAGFLIAGVDESIEREGIVLGSGNLLFDEGAENSELGGVERHIYKVPQAGWFGPAFPGSGLSVAVYDTKVTGIREDDLRLLR